MVSWNTFDELLLSFPLNTKQQENNMELLTKIDKEPEHLKIFDRKTFSETLYDRPCAGLLEL